MIWKLLQILLDQKVKTADKEQKDELAERKRELAQYERLATNTARLLGVLHQAIKEKVKRLKRVVHRGLKTTRIEHVRNALTPKGHLEGLLDGVTAYFCEQLSEGERPTRRFRVGVYVCCDGVMTPIEGVSNREPGRNPFSSFKSHQDRFRFDATDPSHVVRVIHSKGIIVVEDCEAAAKGGGFFYFNSNQPNYLRSMVSCYLGEVCLSDGRMAEAALVVDTDAPGFFKESEQEVLRYNLEEFGVRIKLELLLVALIERQGPPNDRSDSTKTGSANGADEASGTSEADGGG